MIIWLFKLLWRSCWKSHFGLVIWFRGAASAEVVYALWVFILVGLARRGGGCTKINYTTNLFRRVALVHKYLPPIYFLEHLFTYGVNLLTRNYLFLRCFSFKICCKFLVVINHFRSKQIHIDSAFDYSWF